MAHIEGRSLEVRRRADLEGVQADPIPGMLCDVPGDMSDHLLLQELTSQGVVDRIKVQLGIACGMKGYDVFSPCPEHTQGMNFIFSTYKETWYICIRIYIGSVWSLNMYFCPKLCDSVY
jgi:hypothetical protein